MKINKQLYIKEGVLLLMLNTVASFLNYIFQLILAKMLSVDSFGTANTVFAFMLVAGVPGTTLTMIAAKYCAQSEHSDAEKGCFIGRLSIDVSILTVLFFAAFLTSSKVLLKILSIDDKVVLLLTFVLGASGFYHPLYTGVFSGSRRFVLAGIYSLCIPIYKILALLVARMTGNDTHRLYIILFGMVVGTVLTAVIGYCKAGSLAGGIRFRRNSRPGSWIEKEEIYTLVLNACLMLYMNIDLLIVRQYASGKESGWYSAVLLFGRAAYYFSTTIGTMLLPAAASQEGGSIKLLNKSLALMLGFSVICFLPLNIWKELLLQFLYGNAYIGAKEYVAYISIISTALSICTVLANFLAGIGETKTAAFIMIFVNMLVGIYAATSHQIRNTLMFIGIAGIVGSFCIYLSVIVKQNRSIVSK